MKCFAFAIPLIVGGLLLVGGTLEARELTFEERVRAQEAVDRVYYSHQAGVRRPFDQAVPRTLLERKVRTYLKQSAALEEIWHTRISGTMLRRELERMAANTRMPERLRQLYAALEEDAVLIQECLARPALVDRLSRNFFANDATIHAGPRRMAESLRRDLVGGRIDPRADHARRTVTELVRLDRGAESRPGEPVRTFPGGASGLRLELESKDFDRYRARLPDRSGHVGPIIGNGDAFVIHVVLDMTAGSVRFATYTVPRLGWDSWWDRVAWRFDEGSVRVAAGEVSRLPIPLPGREMSLSDSGCVPDDTWDNGSFDDWPEARASHTAVWTGTLMVVWGGPNPGGRYDPATDTWSTMSLTNAPQTRSQHTAVWTGSEMIIWGGVHGSASFDSGGRYDPATDTWRATSTLNAPSPRRAHSFVWTGSEAIVWGGQQGDGTYTDSGGRYDPATDTWSPTSLVDAPSPRSAPGVWTGSRMIVWGGFDGSGSVNTGWSYDPATDTWGMISASNAPPARANHSAVWTGSEMIVWGGNTHVEYVATGGRYDPATDEWTPTSMTEAPAPRFSHSAIWTGSEMIVWGGQDESGPPMGDGARYNPAHDTWTPTSTTNAPASHSYHSAVWTGRLMIVWGGDDLDGILSSGGRYDPVLDAWTPTADTNAPSARSLHSAVWTGNQLIVWGGVPALRAGGRYDPATDTWSATSLTNAPEPRQSHTAVWTGDLMIVWGGFAGLGGPRLDTGGRYDPIADEWTPTSTTDAPSPRLRHTAIWSGSEMIIWGGSISTQGARTATGARYDPSTDLWTPTSTTDAPSARSAHTAVWTGNKMIVWGGQQAAGTWLDSGGQYDPATDLWAPTSAADAPAARHTHTAVMMGSLMTVWGGVGGAGRLDTGGRYDPSADSWTATTTSGAPVPRSDHTAVWTGRVMIIWGGRVDTGADLDTGGWYDPTADAWTATSTSGAPAGRKWHIAVWTGSHMAVWGGLVSGWPGRTGGLYALGHSVDDDGDGMTECQGDCNDGNGAVHPGALETCDGADNDCDRLSDNVPVPFETPGLAIQPPGEAALITWSPVGSATHYDLVRGDLSILLETKGDFSSATQACLADDLEETFSTNYDVPITGSAFWYVVRPVNCGGNGTYDLDGPGQVGQRDAGINASASSCP